VSALAGSEQLADSSDDDSLQEEDDLFSPLDDLSGSVDIDETESEGSLLEAHLPPRDQRDAYALPYPLHLSLVPRDYQSSATDAWLRAGARGMIVLPTGAGKTVIALDALARLAVRTLVIVPTIELLRQWHTQIASTLQVPESEVGIVGGGERRVGPITVMTYDSAAMRGRSLDGFGLLIFDEAHHLPAQSYRGIVKHCPAPWRLGLSATVARADGRHIDLDALIGPVIYQREAEELASQKHIAAFREKRIFVDLSPEEELRYETLMAEWRWYIATRRSQLGSGPGMFAALIRRSGFDASARQALRAHHEARLVALNAGAKIAAIEALLRQHASAKIIVFSEYSDMVDRISRTLMLPAITYRTPPAERRAILADFRTGTLTKLVTGRVLNEGVDVPDASVAIIASGSASLREYVQRLGRVLRPKPGEARLYELISRRTTERNAARRRRPKRKSDQLTSSDHS
jgi:superfamily II DNA or RNA helicase